MIQEALRAADVARTLYIQIPDSDPAGVVAACNGYLETFGIAQRVSSLGELAQLIGRLTANGYVVALDEFQYFHRKQLAVFCSLLQAEVDRLAARATDVPGGLIVLGSLHAEMTALLEDRDAPLFNRATDTLELGHLDIGSLLEMLRVHADEGPARLLFLWNLFEGVPKFYRDAYEQGVLNADRGSLLRSLFFSSGVGRISRRRNPPYGAVESPNMAEACAGLGNALARMGAISLRRSRVRGELECSHTADCASLIRPTARRQRRNGQQN